MLATLGVVPSLSATTRPPLHRDAIVTAAVRVADAGGPAALTMAAVARELGPFTAMALYRHVASKEELLDLMLDAVTAEIPLPDAGPAGWRAALRRLALDSAAMAARHPWYATLAPTRPPLGPHTMARTEAALRALVPTGLPLGEALGHVAMLDRHVYGSAALAAGEAAMAAAHGVQDEAGLAATIRALHPAADAARYPLLAAWMRTAEGPSAAEQLARGVDFLLDGIERRITEPGRG